MPPTPPLEIQIYTDGSAIPHGPGGWAAILLGADGKRCHYLAGAAKETTNNDMEFTAALYGLRYVWEYGARVTIFTDSELLVGYMSRGYAEGKSKTKPKPHLQAHRVNMRAWIANFGLEVRWVHVKGHAGDKWNEKADEIANFMRSLAKDDV